MWFFYVFAILPVAAGAAMWYFDKKILWWEWLIGSASAFVLAGILHGLSLWGMTADSQTLSGVVTKVSHYPRWVEEYQERHEETYYTGSGKDRQSHTRVWYTTEHDTHPEHWRASRNFGRTEDDVHVDRSVYNEIARKFGNDVQRDGTQSCDHIGGSFDGGDNKIYSVFNRTGYMEPATTTHTFQNKIKAAPSVFSFTKVPTNILVYPWPANEDWRHSERLCGTASVLINLYKFDCLNSSLGPSKKVNLIMVGFGKEAPDYGQYQQAKWIGGKKNDLVLCFGGATKNQPAQWSYVFGWTESEIVKKNLQSILLQNPINDSILPLIAEEVNKNYVIKDWHKFDYISIDPPTWSYWVYFILMILTQGGLYIFFHYNEMNDSGFGYNFRNFRRFRY